jgi:thymidine kinase
MPKKDYGVIHLIFGCMGSGKTGELLRRKRRAEIAKKKCVLIKYYKDVRYSIDKVSTHDGVTAEAVTSVGNSLGKTIEAIKDLNEYDCIFVDEIQFYPDGAEICEKLANNGFDVTVCGLQGDYNRKMFETVIKLIPMSEEVVQLTAIDPVTGRDAAFTARLTTNSEQEFIAGMDAYTAADRSRYFALTKK